MAAGTAGCREFGTVRISQSDHGIEFGFQWNEKALEAYVIDELAVVKQNCSEDCTYWELRRTLDDPDATATAALSGPLAYGREVADVTEPVPAVPLKSGTYSVTANIAPIKDNTVGNAQYYTGAFSIVREAGDIVLVHE
jgi:hypothetical protein